MKRASGSTKKTRPASGGRPSRVRAPSRVLLAVLFAAAFALVPALAAVPRALRLLEVLAPEGPSVLGLSAPAGSFLLGACLFALAFVAVRIPAIAYVSVHETTHALFGLLSGARVTRLRVSEEAGSVDVSRPNALNLLAPYFFPLPCVAALLLFGLLSLVFPMVGPPAGSVAASGADTNGSPVKSGSINLGNCIASIPLLQIL